MKHVVVVLLLANAAVWLYLHNTQPTEPPPAAKSVAAPPTILLAGERPAPAAECVSVGPLATPTLRDAVRAWLADRFGPVTDRETAMTAPPSYRVQVASTSADLAARLAQKMRATGDTDVVVLTPEAGDTTVVVAFGLFAEQAHAERRAADLRRRGIEASISTLEKRTPQWWLDLSTTTLPDAETLHHDVPASAAVGLRPCESAEPGDETPAPTPAPASPAAPVTSERGKGAAA